jgi:hypothetical protein
MPMDASNTAPPQCESDVGIDGQRVTLAVHGVPTPFAPLVEHPAADDQYLFENARACVQQHLAASAALCGALPRTARAMVALSPIIGLSGLFVRAEAHQICTLKCAALPHPLVHDVTKSNHGNQDNRATFRFRSRAHPYTAYSSLHASMLSSLCQSSPGAAQLALLSQTLSHFTRAEGPT